MEAARSIAAAKLPTCFDILWEYLGKEEDDMVRDQLMELLEHTPIMIQQQRDYLLRL